MPTLDMRPSVTPNEGADESEEAKDATNPVEGEETPAESSPAEETETEEIDAPLEEAPAAEETQEEAPDPVLTAREAQKAQLLKEIEDLRAERRKERGADPLIVPAKPKEEVVDLADVNENDVKLIEKVLKAKGYVRKDEFDGIASAASRKQTMESEKDAWLAKHPEYLPANDPEDKNWNALNATLSAYFKAPDNPKEISRVLDAAHALNNPNTPTMPVKSKASVDAAKDKISSSSKGTSGGASKTTPGSKSKMDLSGLQGFSDEELAEMQA